MSMNSRIQSHDFGNRRIECTVLSPDGQLAAIGSPNGSILLCSMPEFKFIQELQGHTSFVGALAFINIDEKLVLMSVSSSESELVRLWEPDKDGYWDTRQMFVGSFKDSWLISHLSAPDLNPTTAIVKSSDLWVGTPKPVMHDVMMCNIHSRLNSCTTQSLSTAVITRTFSTDETLVAACVISDIIVQEAPDMGDKRTVLRGHTNTVYCVSFSPVQGSGLIASGSRDLTVRIWIVEGSDVLTHRFIHSLCGHVDWVINVKFSSDGKRLATGSFDSTVRIWDVDKGIQLMKLNTDGGYTHRIAFHPNDKQVIAQRTGSKIDVWTVCEWSDRTHYLFFGEIRRIVFQLMCVRDKLNAGAWPATPFHRLSMTLWLLIFEWLNRIIDNSNERRKVW